MSMLNLAVENVIKAVTKLIIYISIWHCVCSVTSVAQYSKLCGDSKCTEKLFEARFIRGYNSSHFTFLTYSPDNIIGVYAIRMSGRPELFEGVLHHQPDSRGYFFSTHIETDGYAKFLKEALQTNRTFFRVGANLNEQSNQAPKVIGTVAAVPELLKEYEKVLNASALAKEQVPQPLDLATLGLKKITVDSFHAGHGHSHGPHGHSHDIYVKIEEEHAHGDEPAVANKYQSDSMHGHAHSHIVENSELKNVPMQNSISEKSPSQTGDPGSNAESLGIKQQSSGSVGETLEAGVAPPALSPENTPSTKTIVQPPPVGEEKAVTMEPVPMSANTYSPTLGTTKSVNVNPPQPNVEVQKDLGAAPQHDYLRDVITNNANYVTEENHNLDTLNEQPERRSDSSEQIPLPPVDVNKQSNDATVTSDTVQRRSVITNSDILTPSQSSSSENAKIPDASTHPATPSSVIVETASVPQNPTAQKDLSGIQVPASEAKQPSVQDASFSDVRRDAQVVENITPLQSTADVPLTQTASSLQQQEVTTVTLVTMGNTVDTRVTLSEYDAVSPAPYSDVTAASGESSLPIYEAANPTVLTTTLSSATTTVSSDINAQASAAEIKRNTQEGNVAGDVLSSTGGQQQSSHLHHLSVSDSVPTNAPSVTNTAETVVPYTPLQERPPEELVASAVTTTTEMVMQDQHFDSTESPQGYDIVGSDGLGYCVKGNCGNSLDKEPLPQSNEERAKPAQNLFGNLSNMYLLPSGEIDLTKVVFMLLGLLLLSIHFIMMMWGSEGDKENVENKMLHDALSAIKVRDQRIKELFYEVEKAQSSVMNDSSEEVVRLDKELKLKDEELKRLHPIESEMKVILEENKALKNALSREEAKIKVLTDQLDKSENSIKMLNEQLIEVQSNSDVVKDKNENLEKENIEKNVKLEKSLKEIEDLKGKLRVMAEEKRNLSKQIDELQFENAQLSELYEEMQKHANNGNIQSLAENVNTPKEHATSQESGGSGGWSDIDDFEIDAVDEKKVTSTKDEGGGKPTDEQNVKSYSSQTTSNIVEIARLRGQLERAKLKLQEEEKSSEELLRRLNLAESEAAKCRKEVELKDAERVDIATQCRKLFTMVEEKDARLKRLDEVIERLRDEKAKVQDELKKILEEKQHLETKLNEVEQELKRLQADHDRLKKRHFHELRECRQENSALQQRLKSKKSGAAESVLDDGGDLFTLSGNVPDNASLSPTGLLPGLSVPPLWSDGDTDMFSGAESSRTERSASLRNRQSLFDDVPQYSSGKPQKSRHREHRETSPEPSSGRSKKEGRRMRSRSHGRSAAYMPAGMPFSLSSGFDIAARREYLSGGNLYYSSGGSNGGLSPPPLALLSGVPPPDVGIRKPTASARPKSVVEHGSRNLS